MPWTVCVRRTPTPPGWAMRSTFLDRCLQPGPALPGPLSPPPWVGARLGSVRLPGNFICLTVWFTWERLRLSTGRRRDGLPRAGLGAGLIRHLPPWSLCRPGTGTRSCRRQGNYPARTCLSGCFEKELYSRCLRLLLPDWQPQACLPPAKRAGQGTLPGIGWLLASGQTIPAPFCDLSETWSPGAGWRVGGPPPLWAA